MLRDVLEVVVAREHQQIVANAELGKERIDRTGLYSMATTGVAWFCRVNVILSPRHQEGQCREPLEYLFSRLGPRKTLKEFLQDEPGGQDRLPALNHPDQCHHVRSGGGAVTSERKRPHAGVDEDAQPLERSDL